MTGTTLHRLVQSLHRVELIDQFYEVIMQEIEALSPELAKRVVIRMVAISTEWSQVV